MHCMSSVIAHIGTCSVIAWIVDKTLTCLICKRKFYTLYFQIDQKVINTEIGILLKLNHKNVVCNGLSIVSVIISLQVKLERITLKIQYLDHVQVKMQGKWKRQKLIKNFFEAIFHHKYR